MLLLSSTSANTIGSTFSSISTNSQSQNPELVSSPKRPTFYYMSLHLLSIPWNSPECLSLLTSLPVSGFCHPSPAFFSLWLNLATSVPSPFIIPRDGGIPFYLVEHRRARQGPQKPRVSSS